MEHREDGLMVDYSGIELSGNGARQGNYPVVYAPKQEREMQTLDQETRLMRAMNEIRAYSPKNMNRSEREMFSVMCENIFKKHGITPEVYRQQFGHLGTPQNLHR
jgi:hypothetical protein